MTTPLRFQFNLEKLVNALAYFADKGVSDLTILKAAKLLYFLDQYHLHHYGRPVTGDSYVAWELGPVPDTAYQLISRIVARDEVNDPAKQRVAQHLSVFRGFWGTLKYPQLRARIKPDLNVFSDSDIEALDATLAQYGKTPANQLVDLSHEHKAYKRADKGRPTGSKAPLPYDYFFEDAPDNLRDAAECRAETYQEARRFSDSLREAAQAIKVRKKLAPTQG